MTLAMLTIILGGLGLEALARRAERAAAARMWRATRALTGWYPGDGSTHEDLAQEVERWRARRGLMARGELILRGAWIGPCAVQLLAWALEVGL
jgi:hypothetical protein